MRGRLGERDKDKKEHKRGGSNKEKHSKKKGEDSHSLSNFIVL